MRKIIDKQMKLGEVDISNIKFDLKSRDEIPKLLMGLQYIYCNAEIREKVFSILSTAIPCNISKINGRPGMDLWKILVLGVLRLNCNWDFDKVKEIADNHATLREMLGHVKWFDTTSYPLQTIKDNVGLLTDELLCEINKIVIDCGHNLIKKKDEELKCRCDSFVVESNVHYPTDVNLLFDAVRKSVELIAAVCEDFDLTIWRQVKYNIKKIKNALRKFQKMKHSTSKDEVKKTTREKEIKTACKLLMKVSENLLNRVLTDMANLRDISTDPMLEIKFIEINRYIDHAERQLDQVNRRIINGETIPHCEKVFSIFEEYTEWLSKGKAGVSQELGLNVCIIEDQFGFILNHRVMQSEVDKTITVPFTKETKELFPNLNRLSLDKGFWSPANRIELEKIIDNVILPKKGKLAEKDKEREYSQEFKKAKQKHSAVESGINALENHGLDRCPDHGIKAFKRYIAMAVLGRNLQILGNIVQEKEIAKAKRAKKRKHVKRKMAA